MKTKFKFIGIWLLALAIVFSPPIRAQDSTAHTQDGKVVVVATAPKALVSTDSVILKTSDSTHSTVPASEITAPSNTTFFGIKIPVWLASFLTSLVLIFPMVVQIILKLVPSSSPIGGILGWILNVLTFYIKNKKETPPPGNP